MKTNRKKNAQARRRRPGYPSDEDWSEVTVPATPGDPGRVAVMAVRGDGAPVERVKGHHKPPSRHVHIPRKVRGMMLDPWHGRGKHTKGRVGNGASGKASKRGWWASANTAMREKLSQVKARKGKHGSTMSPELKAKHELAETRAQHAGL